MLPLVSALVSYLGVVTSQADCDASKNATFFGLQTWYKYLKVTYFQVDPKDPASGVCRITSFDPTKNLDGTTTQSVLSSHSPFLLVVLSIIDDLLRVAALVAIAFIIVGAFRYITSQGNPDDASKAQSTVVDALIGLVIAIIAVGVVSYIGNTIGGK